MGQVNCCRGSRDEPEPVQQCVPIPASWEPLLRQRVRVTQGRVTRRRDLLLFRDTLVIAKHQRGSAPRPKLCLALGQLQVLGSAKGAAGDASEEEEGKHTTSLLLVWPCGSCVITFRCRAVKELWLSALLGPPEGVEGAQVTRLPSFKALLKELRSRNAAMTLHAASLERLLEGQATADAEERPPPVVPSGGRDRSGQLAEGETRSQRRWLPWRFARPGTSAAAEAQGPSPSAHTGVLFGRPLAALCSQDGALPQPIQDLLALLHEQGPSTEGIFRLAASERASRDIREALDTGAQVHLASQPVHVLAVILKDFLRKIPSKLLHSELYQQWMDALQKTSRQERLAGLKEVAGKLPEANLLLLRTLLSLLHKISTNVPVTKMTARNLAICVGPNLLSPPEEDTLALDVLMQVTGKVSELVEFLIQHHEELFEEQEEEEAELPGAPAEAELASQQAEESPAPEEEGETAEVPPVAPECEPQESTSGQTRCPSSSQQGETPSPRKRKHSCEEEVGGPPPKRCRKL